MKSLSVTEDDKLCLELDSDKLKLNAERLYSDEYKSLGIGPDPKCEDWPFVKQILVGHVGRRGTMGKYTSAACSVTLIKTLDRLILVDCASGFEKDSLIEALSKEGITPVNVTHLIITHWHTDHCGNISLFPLARVIAPTSAAADAYSADKFSFKIGTDISVEHFAGHTACDLVVFVKQTSRKQANDKGDEIRLTRPSSSDERVIAIVGDLFECEGDQDPKADLYWKANSLAPQDQAIAREFCVQYADIIVPGHGPAFSCSVVRPGVERLKTTFPTTSWEGIKKWEVAELLSFAYERDTHRVFLIHSAGYRILVNTGTVNQLNNLRNALSNVGTSVEEINYIVITTPSLQTCSNISHFPNATIYMADDVAVPPFYYDSIGHFISIEDRVIIARNFTFENCGQFSVVVSQLNAVNESVNFSLICDGSNAFHIRRYALLFNKYYRGMQNRDLKESDFRIYRTKTEIELGNIRKRRAF